MNPIMKPAQLPNLLDLTRSGLEEFVAGLGRPRFRADQIWRWLWQKDAQDFAAMTNLSKELRAELARRAAIVRPTVEVVRTSRDGTVKFLLGLADGERVDHIETVLIPGARGRYTQCLSTQVGCAMGCTFCSTATLGFTRNLSHGEILGQVLVGRAHLAGRGLEPLRNLVFMGMGEPLLNLDTVLEALTSLQSDDGLNMSWRRSTVSTVGFPDKLKVLGRSGLALPAISLHAPTQELRERIMPKAARVHLDDLMAALDAFPMKPRERITYEYLLLRGVNDSLDHAKQLADLLAHRRCKVNLIAYNPSRGMPYAAPDPDQAERFEKYLWDRGMTATIRRSMGRDIEAACGQLAASGFPPPGSVL